MQVNKNKTTKHLGYNSAKVMSTEEKSHEVLVMSRRHGTAVGGRGKEEEDVLG